MLCVLSGSNDRDEVVREEFERRFRAEVKDITRRGSNARCVQQGLVSRSLWYSPIDTGLTFSRKGFGKGFGKKPKVSLEKAKNRVLALHFVSLYSPILIYSVVSSNICVNSQVMIAWTAKGTLEGEFYRFGFYFVGIALSLSLPHFSRSFHVLSFLSISCYASSAYSTSTVILNRTRRNFQAMVMMKKKVMAMSNLCMLR